LLAGRLFNQLWERIKETRWKFAYGMLCVIISWMTARQMVEFNFIQFGQEESKNPFNVGSGPCQFYLVRILLNCLSSYMMNPTIRSSA